jgi:hypothetical protein
MNKTSRKILVPLIILALGMAIVSTVGAVEYSVQKIGPGPIPGQNPTPTLITGQHFDDDKFRFEADHKFDTDHKPDHDFKPGFNGYWKYPFKPYYWYNQFKPYYYRYYTGHYSYDWLPMI